MVYQTGPSIFAKRTLLSWMLVKIGWFMTDDWYDWWSRQTWDRSWPNSCAFFRDSLPSIVSWEFYMFLDEFCAFTDCNQRFQEPKITWFQVNCAKKNIPMFDGFFQVLLTTGYGWATLEKGCFWMNFLNQQLNLENSGLGGFGRVWIHCQLSLWLVNRMISCFNLAECFCPANRPFFQSIYDWRREIWLKPLRLAGCWIMLNHDVGYLESERWSGFDTSTRYMHLPSY